MKVHSKRIVLPKTNELDIINITDRVQMEVEEAGVREGMANIFVVGSTGAATIMEYEPGLVNDMKNVLERLVPRDMEYDHHRMWRDGNGHSHIRSAILGPSISVPITGGALYLGTWQQIVYIELDNKPRERALKISVLGE
ncbi:MAG TPA: secondary thiamine-phosphate synthase enzyme YjbQ [Candidatus Methanofastidiosa archaeon]|nr:secondary thiamine-phosphate synthase enzyme YjbQ [Candidatus Methanofastidiosa archaeon]HPR41172.1 secondary thiamine-phosphate synthase enzyme YjbQ [Candidatus Methanofastidiosa archaeon]